MQSSISLGKVAQIARREFWTLVTSRTALLGLLVPMLVMIVVFVMAGREARKHAGTAPPPGPAAQSEAGSPQAPPDAAWAPPAPSPAAGEPGEHSPEQEVGMMHAFVFLFLFFLGTVGIGQHLLTSLIEEKASRIVEVLLSAVSPFELMAGKIVGIGAAGLAVVGVSALAMMGVAFWAGFAVRAPAVLLLLVYYVPSFLVAASVFAAVGSACNTIQDAQGLLLPAMVPFLIPMFAWMHIAAHPMGVLATVLSFIPLTGGMTMVERLAATPDVPVSQILGSLLVLVLSVPVAMSVAARVFRIGVLMHGKPPRIRELLRWAAQG